MIRKYRRKEVERIFNHIISLTKEGVLTWGYNYDKYFDGKFHRYWKLKMDDHNHLIVCEETRTFKLQEYDLYFGWLNRASGEISKTQLDELLTLLTADNDVIELNRLSEFINDIETDRKEQK
jgi:hypothetical protein